MKLFRYVLMGTWTFDCVQVPVTAQRNVILTDVLLTVMERNITASKQLGITIKNIRKQG